MLLRYMICFLCAAFAYSSELASLEEVKQHFIKTLPLLTEQGFPNGTRSMLEKHNVWPANSNNVSDIVEEIVNQENVIRDYYGEQTSLPSEVLGHLSVGSRKVTMIGHIYYEQGALPVAVSYYKVGKGWLISGFLWGNVASPLVMKLTTAHVETIAWPCHSTRPSASLSGSSLTRHSQ